MNKLLSFLTILLVLQSCISNKKPALHLNTDTLKIRQIAKNVFVHISYLQTDTYGKVACNGMVYFNGNEAIVFDTPTDDAVSHQLISWITKERQKTIKAIVVTHFHEDCLGGLNAFHKSNIASYSNLATIKLARQDSIVTLPQQGFENEMDILIGQQQVLVKYFGEGHTQDNVVGYLPQEKVLFGGCLLKALNASKGYLGDANTNTWSKTVRHIKKEWPNIEHVIPGHGECGNADLLDYTISLFEK